MPIENLTTYVELDPNGKWTVTAPTAAFLALPRDEESGVYDDKGVNHFDGDIEHLFDFIITAADTGGLVTHWALTNIVEDAFYFRAAVDYALQFAFNQGSVSTFTFLEEDHNGSTYNDQWTGAVLNTRYYVSIKRDESIGSFGQLESRIYSDAGRTTLLTTLSLALHEKVDLRYVFAGLSWDTSTTQTVTGDTSNLNLQEAAAIIGKVLGMFGLGKLGIRC